MKLLTVISDCSCGLPQAKQIIANYQNSVSCSSQFVNLVIEEPGLHGSLFI